MKRVVAGIGGLTWPKNPGFRTFSVISGLWRDRWRAVWISTILTFQSGAIRAMRNFCRWPGCRKADLLTLALGRLEPLWAVLGRFGPPQEPLPPREPWPPWALPSEDENGHFLLRL